MNRLKVLGLTRIRCAASKADVRVVACSLSHCVHSTFATSRRPGSLRWGLINPSRGQGCAVQLHQPGGGHRPDSAVRGGDLPDRRRTVLLQSRWIQDALHSETVGRRRTSANHCGTEVVSPKHRGPHRPRPAASSLFMCGQTSAAHCNAQLQSMVCTI